MENIKNGYTKLRNNWWGGIPVYFSLFGTLYLSIWGFIEPLDIPLKIPIYSSTLDRRFLHISLSIFLASHIILFMGLLLRYLNRSQNLNVTEKQGVLLTQNMILAVKNSDLCVQKKDLIMMRAKVRDGKYSEMDFSEKILWSLICGEIDVKFAEDLLIGSSYKPSLCEGKIATIEEKAEN